ncbi:adenosine deaminase [Rhodovibrionaceae bacterium A322]
MPAPAYTPDSFIAGLPKAELHLHIEGTLEPEMMMTLAKRNGVTLPYGSVAEIREAYSFGCLQDFLDLYYAGMSVLRTEQDFYELTRAYLEKVKAQGVTHVEIFFDPQGHTERGLSFDLVLQGITRALDSGAAELGISHKLIMCFLRHLSEEAAFETLEQALPHKDKIFGVGLDSSELGHPPEKFQRVFAKAIAEGFVPVAHCGEEGPADYVRQGLNLLKLKRIDHGNRLMEDPVLINRVAREGLALTLCPLSNLRLQVVTDLSTYPLRQMMEAGLLVTLNSDDPSYFGGYMNENYQALKEALELSQEELAQLARNSYLGSFLSPGEKDAGIKGVDDYVKAAS